MSELRDTDPAGQEIPPRPPVPPAFPAYTTQPTQPLPPYGSAGTLSQGGMHPAGPSSTGPQPELTKPAGPDKDRGRIGAGKVTALIVAAALVGGAAGLGGTAVGNALWSNESSTPAAGPPTVTVNNTDEVVQATAIAAKVLPSVVTLDVESSSALGSGSGVIISEDGYVLTNTHVVTLDGDTATPGIRVTASDGRIYDAEVVGLDPIYDLAVIKLAGAEGLTPIEFADSSNLNVGETVLAVGAPLGLSNTVTTGIISALNRSIQISSAAVPDDGGSGETEEPAPGEGGQFFFDIPGLGDAPRRATESISIAVLQTDAAINPGNSGGALVDTEGKLVGINVAIATAGSASESGSIGVGFSIPSNIAQRVAEEIIETGAATHGLLGASVRHAAYVDGVSIAGAYIAEVTPGGAAARVGLRPGDIVTEFNGVPITDATDLTAQVRAAAAGSDATLTFVRGDNSTTVDVTLGELQ